MTYKALHDRFDLPPPPALTVWSLARSHESQRAWLPDFPASAAPVEELRRFLIDCVAPKLSPGVRIQLKVIASISAVLIGTHVVQLALRARRTPFSLFRRIQRPYGVLIVPEAITVVTAFGTVFCTCHLALIWTFVVSAQERRPVKCMWIWLTATWFPLAWAVYFYVVGWVYVRPRARASATSDLSRRSSQRTVVRRHGLEAWAINAAMLGAPVTHWALLMVPICLADRRWQSALASHVAWEERWGSSKDLDREMLLQAQQVWYAIVASSRYAALAFALWAVSAFVLAAAIIMSGNAITSFMRSQIAVQAMRLSACHTTPMRCRTTPLPEARQGPLGQRAPSPITSSYSGTTCDDVKLAEPQHSDSAGQRAQPTEGTASSSDAAPPIQLGCACRSAAVATVEVPDRRYHRVLQKLLVEFILQWVLMAGASLFLCGVALAVSILCTPQYEANHFEALEMPCLLAANYMALCVSLLFHSLQLGKLRGSMDFDSLATTTRGDRSRHGDAADLELDTGAGRGDARASPS
ncbi:uncharacterized protein PFL1_02923 [Pseudozyma flocculosa PF-1]|uniref:Uncharacterized protein n=1 Tax=Pseudozyma flocculosa PF-1 TaxID=1277687 RepID=A0A061HAQ4_9BASI|nr:uncharacterized protein PFL1_02923 [Pseudozyma flocculosa PF-1]EPQ29703.1 hypothetical protein PFL1_02923 [Pseudozyma flocculosa PF-1]